MRNTKGFLLWQNMDGKHDAKVGNTRACLIIPSGGIWPQEEPRPLEFITQKGFTLEPQECIQISVSPARRT